MTAAIYEINGAASFTRRQGTAPAWHQMGGETPADAPLEVWAANARMDFTIESARALFTLPDGTARPFPGRKALYRSDNQAPMAIVSDRYKVVQPREVLEFFRSLTEAGGYQMETAGVLGEGGRYFALATNGASANIGGDIIKPYLLLATACDGSLATTAQFTSVRVVCDNTLQMSLSEGGAVKVRHNTRFNPDAVKAQLGIGETWDQFVGNVDRMASRSLTDAQVANALFALFGDDDKPKTREAQSAQTINKMTAVWTKYAGRGRGADFSTARGTAWGLLNAITEFVDHDMPARSVSNRADSSLFGAGAALKARAFELLSA